MNTIKAKTNNALIADLKHMIANERKLLRRDQYPMTRRSYSLSQTRS
jgi:hypothetical protein